MKVLRDTILILCSVILALLFLWGVGLTYHIHPVIPIAILIVFMSFWAAGFYHGQKRRGHDQ